MPVYEYRCSACDGLHRQTMTVGEYGALAEIPECRHCGVRLKRRFSFAAAEVLHEHWNHSLGGPVSDHRKFREGLRRKSDEMSARLGQDVNLQPIDASDPTTVGASPDAKEKRVGELRGSRS